MVSAEKKRLVKTCLILPHARPKVNAFRGAKTARKKEAAVTPQRPLKIYERGHARNTRNEKVW
jgi:hypothetical protein